jgi:hypothetical protein
LTGGNLSYNLLIVEFLETLISADHHAEVIKDVGIFGLKTLIALNSKSIVVILNFLTNVIQINGDFKVDYSILRVSSLSFALGIIFSLASVLATYLIAKNNYAHSLGIAEKSSARPLLLMILPAVVSFVSFAVGLGLSVYAIGAL